MKKKAREYYVEYINQELGMPVTPWTSSEEGMRANVGNYHIDYDRYSGYKLQRMCNEQGGVSMVNYSAMPSGHFNTMLETVLKILKTHKKHTITVLGRRWFDKPNGNTYNTVRILVDGKEVATLPREYGYGTYYLQRAKHWLDEHGIINLDKYPNGVCEDLRWYCERNGIALVEDVVDVQRRRDLHNGGAL